MIQAEGIIYIPTSSNLPSNKMREAQAVQYIVDELHQDNCGIVWKMDQFCRGFCSAYARGPSTPK